ncbi:MAG TPA: cytochrome c3 family protein [Pyrinomonadaceae bacterium]|nr:cytochrome c3 family protein [Pyrinomonadaceae bacterium]
MKIFLALAALACYTAFGLSAPTRTAAPPEPFDGRAPAKEYLLSKDSKKKDGAPVPFNHENHSTKNYSADGTRPITCVECHHTDQPAADAAKTPPLKTAHPADRKTTLTTDLLAKDSTAPDVLSCRACHAQEGQKPRVGGEIPSVTYEGDTDPTVLNNEEAYHRNCNVCHDLAVEKRKTLKIPTSQQCKECHTGPK